MIPVIVTNQTVSIFCIIIDDVRDQYSLISMHLQNNIVADQNKVFRKVCKHFWEKNVKSYFRHNIFPENVFIQTRVYILSVWCCELAKTPCFFFFFFFFFKTVDFCNFRKTSN